MKFTSILRQWRRNESGVVTVELAIFASIMMVLAIPVFDLAKTIYDNMRLTAALRTATYYAYRMPTDTSGIEAALRAATPLENAQLSMTNEQFCECGGIVIGCGASCNDSKATYMNLTAHYVVPLNILYPGMGNAYEIDKTTTIRVK